MCFNTDTKRRLGYYRENFIKRKVGYMRSCGSFKTFITAITKTYAMLVFISNVEYYRL